jgi:hypothetical protein
MMLTMLVPDVPPASGADWHSVRQTLARLSARILDALNEGA